MNTERLVLRTQGAARVGAGGPIARANSLLASQPDVFLAIAVISVLGLLVFRIPPILLDVLLAINIAISALVLLLALYVRDVRQFPSFPTIILLTTLFRLALNVSTTRLILLEAHGGEIIEAFGQFVVGGNLIVGAVVFILLVIVQFIVIAKGSERVSEVGARFSLDSLPGKQMAIDNDQRNGAIDSREAIERREQLNQESKLYGAMEGAMKFVKGDAIAGIIVSAVNIAAGVVIGVTQQGMTAAESVETFSLLTVGDGLVSQIPSIIICVSAGLVVTKVVSSEKASVASDMVTAITSNRKALAILAILLAALAGVPGFPTMVFLVLAAVVGAVWIKTASQPQADFVSEDGGLASIGERGAGAPSSEDGPMRGLVQTSEGWSGAENHVGLGLGRDFQEMLDAAGERDGLIQEIAQRVRQTGAWLGIGALDLLEDEALADQLPARGYAVVLRGTIAAIGEMDLSRIYAEVPAERLRSVGLEAEPVDIPWRAVPGSAVPLQQGKALARAGFRSISVQEYVMRHMESAIRQNAHLYLTIESINRLLESLEENNGQLPKQLRDSLKSADHSPSVEISQIFRQLLRDGFPILSPVYVLESIARHAGARKGRAGDLYDDVREELAGPMCRKLLLRRPADSRALRLHYLEPNLRQLLEDASVRSHGIITNPRVGEVLERSIRESLDPIRCLLEDPILVVPREHRAAISREMRERIPQLVVLASNEIRGKFEHEMAPVLLAEDS